MPTGTIALRDRVLFLFTGKVPTGLFAKPPSPTAELISTAVFPGSRGEAAPRTTDEFLAAYSQSPWLRASVHRVSDAVSAVPFKVLAARGRRNGSNGKFFKIPEAQSTDYKERKKALRRLKQLGELVEIEDHPIILALNASNEFFTGKATRKLTQIYLDLVGEAFLLKERNVAGAPVGLWPLPPHWIADTPTPADPAYEVNNQGVLLNIPSTEIIWLKDADPLNPYGRGSGFAEAMADELQSYEDATKTIVHAMRNRGLPQAIIAPEDGMWGEDQTRAFEINWRNRLQGFLNAVKPLFLRQKVSVTVLPQDFKQLQLLELTQHERDTIIQVFGVPPEKLGIVENSNRATSEAADLTFAKEVVMPRLEFIREIYQVRLVPEYDDRLIVDFDTPIGADKEHALKVVQAAPWSFHVDEIREMAELEALDDDAGKLFAVPTNVRFVSELEGVEPPPPPPVPPPAVRPQEMPEGPPPRGLLVKQSDPDDDSGFFLNVHRAARKFETQARKIFLSAVDKTKESVSEAKLEAALLARNIGAAERAIDLSIFAEVMEDLEGVITEAAEESARLAGIELAQALENKAFKQQQPLPFDSSDQRFREWLDLHLGELIVQVSDETRKAIKETIIAGFEADLPPRVIAAKIKSLIGVTSRQAAAAEKFFNQLIADGIETQRAIERLERFQAAQLRRRAITIARTETLTATNMGQQLLWQQTVDRGLLDPQEARRVWIVAMDDRLDVAICEPTDGQKVKLNEPFTVGNGAQVMNPPAHPNCRCTTGLTFEE